MNDSYGEFPTDVTLTNDGSFHIAIAWLAVLSALIFCVGVPFLMVL